MVNPSKTMNCYFLREIRRFRSAISMHSLVEWLKSRIISNLGKSKCPLFTAILGADSKIILSAFVVWENFMRRLTYSVQATRVRRMISLNNLRWTFTMANIRAISSSFRMLAGSNQISIWCMGFTGWVLPSAIQEFMILSSICISKRTAKQQHHFLTIPLS